MQKVYTASTAEAYKAPDPTQEYTYPRHRARFGLVCADTLAEAALSYGSGLSSKAGFDTTHGGKDMTPTEVASMYHTTQRDSMALATSIRASAAAAAAKDAHHLEHSIFARAAGGAGSVNHDRGKKTMGIAGEVLRTTDDSRMNTAAQRSWMYGPDPGLSAVANVSATLLCSAPVVCFSVALHGCLMGESAPTVIACYACYACYVCDVALTLRLCLPCFVHVVSHCSRPRPAPSLKVCR